MSPLPTGRTAGHSPECWRGMHQECSPPATCACEAPGHDMPHPNGGDVR